MKKIDNFKKSIHGKRVAVIGAGVSNVPLVSYLKKLDCEIVLFDKKELNDMDKEVKDVILNNDIKYFTGNNYLDNLNNFDYIFRSPSFLPTNPVLIKEIERGAIVTTEVEQVIKLTPSKIIAVTGSKGKTTTTTIINSILESLGYHTFLGGNIGTPLFTKIEEMKKDDIVVLELSSFQLMNMKVSPDVAVVTNISPDHLDIHSSYNEYIDAKKYIFKNQNKNSYLILNNDDDIVKNFNKEAIGHVKYFGSSNIKDSYILDGKYITYNGKKIINTDNLILRGKHNFINICAALNAISVLVDLPNDKLEDIIKNINSVHHRLEFIRDINGVRWYNDSASTTPDKAMAGIYAFDNPIVLIAGGYDKNIDYNVMAKPILDKVSKLILFGQTKDKIYNAVMDLMKVTGKNINIYVMDSLEEVVEVAYRVSEAGEVVLFSPASASFDMFKNAYQRGDKFVDLVKKL